MKRFTGQNLEGALARASVSTKGGSSVSLSPSQCLDVFTDLEALRIPHFWDLVDASSSRHDQLLALFLAHSLEK